MWITGWETYLLKKKIRKVKGGIATKLCEYLMEIQSSYWSLKQYQNRK